MASVPYTGGGVFGAMLPPSDHCEASIFLSLRTFSLSGSALSGLCAGFSVYCDVPGDSEANSRLPPTSRNWVSQSIASYIFFISLVTLSCPF